MAPAINSRSPIQRQPTNPADNTGVGTPGNPPGRRGQDTAKIKRYADYLQFAYQQANGAVEAILNAIGSQHGDEPRRDVFARCQDHGMAPFHTAVGLRNLLANAGVNVNLLGIRTTGPAANVYVNLQGREAGGNGTTRQLPTGYAALVAQVAAVLQAAKDPIRFYNPGGLPSFSDVLTRPNACGFPGFCVDENFGQDTGDVLALMIEGLLTSTALRPRASRGWARPPSTRRPRVYSSAELLRSARPQLEPASR